MTDDGKRETPEQAEDYPEQAEGYEPPRVEEIPEGDGPAVTAAGHQDEDVCIGPEWRAMTPPGAGDDRPVAGA